VKQRQFAWRGCRLNEGYGSFVIYLSWCFRRARPSTAKVKGQLTSIRSNPRSIAWVASCILPWPDKLKIYYLLWHLEKLLMNSIVSSLFSKGIYSQKLHSVSPLMWSFDMIASSWVKMSVLFNSPFSDLIWRGARIFDLSAIFLVAGEDRNLRDLFEATLWEMFFGPSKGSSVRDTT